MERKMMIETPGGMAAPSPVQAVSPITPASPSSAKPRRQSLTAMMSSKRMSLSGFQPIQLREILRPQMKDVIDAEHRLRDACVEGLLTMLFVYFATGTVVGSGNFPNAGNGLESSRLLQIAFAFGMSILVLVYSFGHISGAHINPAVTLALTLIGACDKVRAVYYMIAQTVGAVFASFLVWGSTSFLSYDTNGKTLESVGVPPYNLGANRIDGINVGNGFLLEMMGTLLLCLCVLFTVKHKGSLAEGRPSAAPLPIGFAVFVSHLFLVPFTGCGINPARTLGPAIVVSIAGNPKGAGWPQIWIYIVGPLVGSALAAGVFHLLKSAMVENAPSFVQLPQIEGRSPTSQNNGGDIECGSPKCVDETAAANV